MVELEILDSISAYTKNRLVFWSDDKILLLGTDVIGLNYLKRKRKELISLVGYIVFGLNGVQEAFN